jgi:hypothetical protein
MFKPTKGIIMGKTKEKEDKKNPVGKIEDFYLPLDNYKNISRCVRLIPEIGMLMGSYSKFEGIRPYVYGGDLLHETSPDISAMSFLHEIFYHDIQSSTGTQGIINILQVAVIHFLKENKELFKAVYQTDKNKPLEYTLVLKDYNIDSHSKVYTFNRQYEKTGLNEECPIVLSMIPTDFEDEFTFYKKIEL